MSVLSDIEAAGTKIESFLKSIVTGAKTLQTIWGALSGPTLAAGAAVFYDTVKAFNEVEATASAAATGNIPVAITLSETTVSLVKTVVADAKSGVKTIVADFDALNIKL